MIELKNVICTEKSQIRTNTSMWRVTNILKIASHKWTSYNTVYENIVIILFKIKDNETLENDNFYSTL